MAQRNTYREDEALEEQINLKDILRIGAYLKPYKADVFRILAVVIFMSCIAVSIPYMTKIMIDQIIPAGDMTGLLIWAVCSRRRSSYSSSACGIARWRSRAWAS